MESARSERRHAHHLTPSSFPGSLATRPSRASGRPHQQAPPPARHDCAHETRSSFPRSPFASLDPSPMTVPSLPLACRCQPPPDSRARSRNQSRRGFPHSRKRDDGHDGGCASLVAGLGAPSSMRSGSASSACGVCLLEFRVCLESAQQCGPTTGNLEARKNCRMRRSPGHSSSLSTGPARSALSCLASRASKVPRRPGLVLEPSPPH